MIPKIMTPGSVVEREEDDDAEEEDVDSVEDDKALGDEDNSLVLSFL